MLHKIAGKCVKINGLCEKSSTGPHNDCINELNEWELQTSIQTIRVLCKLSNKQEIKLSLNELTRGIFWAKCVKAGGFKWVGRHSARSPLAQGLRQYT